MKIKSGQNLNHIIQNYISGETYNGVRYKTRRKIELNNHNDISSIEMIKLGIKTRLTLKPSNFDKNKNLKVGDYFVIYSSIKKPKISKILVEVVDIYGLEDHKFISNEAKEGWNTQTLRFVNPNTNKTGEIGCIEFKYVTEIPNIS